MHFPVLVPLGRYSKFFLSESFFLLGVSGDCATRWRLTSQIGWNNCFSCKGFHIVLYLVCGFREGPFYSQNSREMFLMWHVPNYSHLWPKKWAARTLFGSSKQVELNSVTSVSELRVCNRDALWGGVSYSSSRFRLPRMTGGCYQLSLWHVISLSQMSFGKRLLLPGALTQPRRWLFLDHNFKNCRTCVRAMTVWMRKQRWSRDLGWSQIDLIQQMANI